MANDPIEAECSDPSATSVEIEIDGSPVSDANPMPVDVVAGSISIDPGDIEIGAVEIKSATNDNRAEVDLPANITGTDLALAVHDSALPASLGQKTMAASLPVVIASDQSTIPVNDPGLADTVGQKVMAASAAVVIASDQSTIPVNDPGLADTVGQKLMAASAAVVIASDQSAVAVNDPGLPDTLGQKTSAGSTGVVIASDQSAVPVNDPGLPDTLGQKTMANSTGVVIASDQSALTVGGAAADGAAVSGNPVRVAGKDGSGNTQDIATDAAGVVSTFDASTGTATETADVTVDATAGGITVLAANANRKSAKIQNTGSANMRVTIDNSAPTISKGTQLQPGQILTISTPFIVTTAIKAIREGAVSTTASVTEIV